MAVTVPFACSTFLSVMSTGKSTAAAGTVEALFHVAALLILRRAARQASEGTTKNQGADRKQ